MKFCLIYKEEYPWDVRVEKIAKTLAAQGHEVSILARNLKQEPVKEKFGSYKVNRLLKTNWAPLFLQKAINVALFFNPIWIYAVYKNAIGTEKPVLIIRDLPLMFAGILIARIKKTKIIFDMAECYPEMYFSMKKYSKPNLFKKVICSHFLMNIYETHACKLSDHIFVMIEESRDRLVAKGILPEKISIVSNTPQIENNDILPVDHKGESLRMVYVGFITRLRGLDLLIQAAHTYLNNGGKPEDLRIDIIGKGNARNELIDLTNKLNMQNVVRIHGWLDKADVEKIVSQANVGVLTYRVCSHWNTTIPNKIFDYMKTGLPVIATDVITIRRIIEETKSGLVCKDQDVDDVASKLLLLRDPNIRNKLGKNGFIAVKEKYNWNHDSNTMNRAIESLYN